MAMLRSAACVWAGVLLLCAGGASADELIVRVDGAQLGPAPSTVGSTGSPSDDELGYVFIEQVGVIADRSIAVDIAQPGTIPADGALGGVIPAGTALSAVVAHIHPSEDTTAGYLVQIEFGRPVLGVAVIYDYVERSDGFGHASTSYLSDARRREPLDGLNEFVTLSADRLTVEMRVRVSVGAAMQIRVFVESAAQSGTACWEGHGEGLLDVVSDAAEFGGEMYFAGRTRFVPEDDPIAQGSPDATVFGRMRGGVWEDLLGLGAAGTGMCLETFDDGSGERLFFGFDFNFEADGGTARSVAAWDGESFETLGLGFNRAVRDLEVAEVGMGATLFAGGEFFAVPTGPTQAAGVAWWDGAAWQQVGDGLNGSVRRLRALDLGEGARLLAVGGFTRSGVAPVEKIGVWDGESWSNAGGGLLGLVNDVAVFDSGTGARLHAAGRVRIAGEVPLPTASIVRLGDGGWERIEGAPEGEGITLHVDAQRGGGTMLMSGRFVGEAGGGSFLTMHDGNIWRSVRGGPDEMATRMFAGPGGGLRLVGRFHAAGGEIAGGIAELAGCEASCALDADGDGVIGFGDLNAALASYGQSGEGLAGDFNGDGCVDFLDLQGVLVFFGKECL